MDLRHPRSVRAFLLLAAFVCIVSFAVRADEVPRTGGPYVPTPQNVVDEMLKLANVQPQDFVIDLGSGDGRIVLTAARRYSAHGLGFDIDEELVELSNEKAREQGLAGRASFRVQDVVTAPVDGASVLTLYLLPGMTRILQPRLFRELKPGARIVSHDFELGDWKPDRQVSVDVAEKYGTPGSWKSTIFLWVVPAHVEGLWRMAVPAPRGGQWTLRLRQRFQYLEGTLHQNGRRHAIAGAQVDGSRVRFRVSRRGARRDERFEARIEGDRMVGTAELGDNAISWSAVRDRAAQ
ncbi:MAG TPA: class I SAM-dependent methyltransferase [Burkholderiales bacterium]|nr:class I SAM-dependent methyltransferase [Burkholderiales bacterium]